MTDIQNPCPKWCVSGTDEGGGHLHRTHRTVIDRYADGTMAHVSACGGSFGANEIAVHGSYATTDSSTVHADLYVPLENASRLAGVFEALSYIPPDQIRELAAAIRQAETEMTAEPEAGA